MTAASAFCGPWVADEFSARYGDLLTGSDDCVDRIVLNAYNSVCHNPGGFRAWWRRLARRQRRAEIRT